MSVIHFRSFRNIRDLRKNASASKVIKATLRDAARLQDEAMRLHDLWSGRHPNSDDYAFDDRVKMKYEGEEKQSIASAMLDVTERLGSKFSVKQMPVSVRVLYATYSEQFSNRTREEYARIEARKTSK